MNHIKRLQKYLELVTNNIQSTTGPLQEFWQREAKKTSAKIASLQK